MHKPPRLTSAGAMSLAEKFLLRAFVQSIEAPIVVKTKIQASGIVETMNKQEGMQRWFVGEMIAQVFDDLA
jgi:hypothetical protein